MPKPFVMLMAMILAASAGLVGTEPLAAGIGDGVSRARIAIERGGDAVADRIASEMGPRPLVFASAGEGAPGAWGGEQGGYGQPWPPEGGAAGGVC